MRIVYYVDIYIYIRIIFEALWIIDSNVMRSLLAG